MNKSSFHEDELGVRVTPIICKKWKNLDFFISMKWKIYQQQILPGSANLSRKIYCDLCYFHVIGNIRDRVFRFMN